MCLTAEHPKDWMHMKPHHVAYYSMYRATHIVELAWFDLLEHVHFAFLSMRVYKRKEKIK